MAPPVEWPRCIVGGPAWSNTELSIPRLPVLIVVLVAVTGITE